MQTAYYINNSDPSHTCFKQQMEKYLKISPSKNAAEKSEEKKIMAIAKLFALNANENSYRFFIVILNVFAALQFYFWTLSLFAFI